MPIVTFSEAFPRGRGGRRGRRGGRQDGSGGRGRGDGRGSAGMISPLHMQGSVPAAGFVMSAISCCYLSTLPGILFTGAQEGQKAFQGRGQSLASAASAPPPPDGTGVYAPDQR